MLVTVDACRLLPIGCAGWADDGPLRLQLAGCGRVGLNLRSQGRPEGVDESTLARVTLIGAQHACLDAEA